MSDILATKYRPKKIADLVGQDHVVRILTNTIISGDLHNAYIFAGNLGSGKTSSARIFAASLNSPKGPTLEPDLSSPTIKAIFEGKSLDVIEMDAASNRGIDDIRDLKERIQYAPIECGYRFVIIDEAHALTGHAAESALKMIEEPPPRTIFIFATTDPQKMVPTIRSRCMILKFNKIHWSVLSNHLCHVADLEKMSYEKDAMKIAARLSSGSVRNSLQNLQTMHTYAGKNTITASIANECLNSVDENKYFELVDAIIGPDGSKPNAGDAFRVVDSLLGDGRDVGEVFDGLVGHLRNLLIICTSPKTNGLIDLTEDEKKRFIHQRQLLGSNSVAINFLLEAIDILADCRRQIQFNMNPQTMLEKFVIRSIVCFIGLKKQTPETTK